MIRIFKFYNGKLFKVFNETVQTYIDDQQNPKADMLVLDRIDFERRLAVEKEIDKLWDIKQWENVQVSQPNIVFDESNNFIMYSSLLGIKIVNFATNKLVKILGKIENTERFMSLSLFQGNPQRKTTGSVGFGGKSSQEKATDPTLFCTAYKKNRFYLFTKREPQENEGEKNALGRDIFNEKPSKDDLQMAHAHQSSFLPSQSVISTSFGEIHLKLFPNECPKTVENFVTHAKNG